jgi:outer membrane lipase/esterase
MNLSSTHKGIRGLAVALALAALGVLASCGGGTNEVVRFKPTRILAFGDESSLIQADGRKYTINAFAQINSGGVNVDDPNNVDCARNPLWIQSVASAFGLVFDRCQGTAPAASGQILAQAGHKVADLPSQIAAVQGGSLNDLDIAVVLVGQNDILELYSQYPVVSHDAIVAEVRARAASLGEQVNALALRGPAVVVLTVPDLGVSPFAKAEDAATGDSTRSALLSELVAAFNNRMSVTLINDGRLIGLVYADIETQNEARFPAAFGLVDVANAACAPTVTLPACTAATLVSDATAAGNMWADSLHLGPTSQARIGALAAQRAVNNPF